MMKFKLLIALFAFSTMASAQGIEFEHTPWKEALEKAETEGKALFVDSYAEWCGPCKRMAKNVFTQASVGDFFNKNFINLKLDMEKEDGVTFGHKYPVSAYPTLYFLSGDGKVIHKVKGGKNEQALLDLANLVIRKHDTSGKYAEEYEKGNRDYDLVYNYVAALNKSQKPSLKISNEYLRSKPDITEEQRLKFVFESAVESDSKLFEELIANKSAIQEMVDETVYKEKIELASKATVNKAIEYEVESLLDEAIEAYKAALGKDKVAVLKMKSHYRINTGNKKEYLAISKKLFKEVKKDKGEISKLYANLSKYSDYSEFQDLLSEVSKQNLKLDPSEKNVISYAKLLVKFEKVDKALDVVNKKIKELTKAEKNTAQLDRFKKYLESIEV